MPPTTGARPASTATSRSVVASVDVVMMVTIWTLVHAGLENLRQSEALGSLGEQFRAGPSRAGQARDPRPVAAAPAGAPDPVPGWLCAGRAGGPLLGCQVGSAARDCPPPAGAHSSGRQLQHRQCQCPAR